MSFEILAHKDNNETRRKYRIPKSSNDENQEGIEISIDFEKLLFKAKRFKSNSIESIEWQKYNDATFPSYLLNEFIRTDYPKEIKWGLYSWCN